MCAIGSITATNNGLLSFTITSHVPVLNRMIACPPVFGWRTTSTKQTSHSTLHFLGSSSLSNIPAKSEVDRMNSCAENQRTDMHTFRVIHSSYTYKLQCLFGTCLSRTGRQPKSPILELARTAHSTSLDPQQCTHPASAVPVPCFPLLRL